MSGAAAANGWSFSKIKEFSRAEWIRIPNLPRQARELGLDVTLADTIEYLKNGSGRFTRRSFWFPYYRASAVSGSDEPFFGSLPRDKNRRHHYF